MATHIRSVWHVFFTRELLDSGRPIPGCVSVFSPRLLTLISGETEECPNGRCSGSGNDALYELQSSCNFEARTLLALRLEKRWKAVLAECRNLGMRFGRHPVSTRWDFHLPYRVQALFILPGGRYAVTVHQNQLQCWDLGFPQLPDEPRGIEEFPEISGAKCVDKHVLSWSATGFVTAMDAKNQSMKKGDGPAHVFFACAHTDLIWRCA